MHRPDIELLWWDGCPSTERALDELRKAAREAGLGAPPIRMREIRSEDEAHAIGFKGSPTVLVDGMDVAEWSAAAGGATEEMPEPVGLACRVYRTRDGRIPPTPDPADLRTALTAAAQRDVATAQEAGC